MTAKDGSYEAHNGRGRRHKIQDTRDLSMQGRHVLVLIYSASVGGAGSG